LTFLFIVDFLRSLAFFFCASQVRSVSSHPGPESYLGVIGPDGWGCGGSESSASQVGPCDDGELDWLWEGKVTREDAAPLDVYNLREANVFLFFFLFRSFRRAVNFVCKLDWNQLARYLGNEICGEYLPCVSCLANKSWELLEN
jgi:hypothetical protein